MIEPNKRIKNLEQQVRQIHGELRSLRNGMLQKNEMKKLGILMERLKGLNIILNDLRKYYSSMQQSASKKRSHLLHKICPDVNTMQHSSENVETLAEPIAPCRCYANAQHENKTCAREMAGLDQRATVPQRSEESQLVEHQIESATKKVKPDEPFKTCKQLMEEIQPPGSILGDYLMRLQDFRTDPDLKRQRWERKQQEKLKHLQHQERKINSCKDKATTTEKNDFIANHNVVDNLGIESLPKSKDHHDIQLTDKSSEYSFSNVITKNLSERINKVIEDIARKSIVLTIVLEDDIYHISVSQTSNAHPLACFLATEDAIQDAKQHRLFEDILTFFVVKAENSKSQKDRILGHLFEFVKLDVKTDFN